MVAPPPLPDNLHRFLSSSPVSSRSFFFQLHATKSDTRSCFEWEISCLWVHWVGNFTLWQIPLWLRKKPTSAFWVFVIWLRFDSLKYFDYVEKLPFWDEITNEFASFGNTHLVKLQTNLTIFLWQCQWSWGVYDPQRAYFLFKKPLSICKPQVLILIVVVFKFPNTKNPLLHFIEKCGEYAIKASGIRGRKGPFYHY